MEFNLGRSDAANIFNKYYLNIIAALMIQEANTESTIFHLRKLSLRDFLR